MIARQQFRGKISTVNNTKAMKIIINKMIMDAVMCALINKFQQSNYEVSAIKVYWWSSIKIK